MIKKLLLAMALLVLATAANATDLIDWTGTLQPTSPTNPPGFIEVKVNAIETSVNSGIWRWTYDIKPVDGASELIAFSLDVGSSALATINPLSITSSGGAINWYGEKTSSSIQWSKFSGTSICGSAQFAFESTWGPSVMNWGYAQDHGQYAGRVPTPTLPEPMSIMLGMMGLGSVAGFKRLRGK